MSDFESRKTDVQRFAFRGGKPMYAPARLEKSKTGLWSGTMSHVSGEHVTRGHLSKAHAKASLDTQAMGKYGRVPVYIKEDKE